MGSKFQIVTNKYTNFHNDVAYHNCPRNRRPRAESVRNLWHCCCCASSGGCACSGINGRLWWRMWLRMRLHVGCDDRRMWLRRRMWLWLHHLHTASSRVHHLCDSSSCVHHLHTASSSVHNLHTASSSVQHLHNPNLWRMWMPMKVEVVSGCHTDPVIW